MMPPLARLNAPWSVMPTVANADPVEQTYVACDQDGTPAGQRRDHERCARPQ